MRIAESHLSRRSLLAGGLLIAVGESLFAVATYRTFGPIGLVYGAIAHALAAAVAAGFTLVRPVWSATAAGWLTFFLVAPVVVESWINHHLYAATNWLWAPFTGIQVVVLALAFIVPGPFWLNLLLIAGFAVETLLLWFSLDLSGVPSVVAAGEPWFTFLFYSVSAGILVFRWSNQELQQRLIRAQARAEALTAVAGVFLSVRDLSNTPLQNILTAADLLEVRHPEEAPVVGAIRRAVQNLRELGLRLRKLDDVVKTSAPSPSSVEELLREQTRPSD